MGSHEHSRPNILFIMSDDHASNAISAYGSPLAKDAPTPHIDRIGREGMVLEHCHCVNSICTPSRANILTGLHSHLNGVRTLTDPLPADQVLLSELLQESGYATAIFGKWHLHVEPRGFDDWEVLPGQGRYFAPDFIVPGTDDRTYPSDNYGKRHVREGYVTDIITDLTLDWLKQRDPDKPFFLCCHHKAPHDRWEYDRAHEHIFDDITFDIPPTLFEDEQTQQEISRRYGSTISSRSEQSPMVKVLCRPSYPNGPSDFSGLEPKEQTLAAYQKYMLDYLRTVRSINNNVGRILDYLDESGLRENTIVIYTSDQGMLLGEHDFWDKRWFFDESQRMPFLVRYPKEIPPNTRNNDMIDNVDFAPTLLDYAGVDSPPQMQGRSFRPVLAGHTPEGWRQSVYYRYWMHMAHLLVPAHYAIRTQDFKLVLFYGMKLDADCDDEERPVSNTDPGWELYDLRCDPLETTNVYRDPAYIDTVVELKQQLEALKVQYGDTDDRYPELIALKGRLA